MEMENIAYLLDRIAQRIPNAPALIVSRKNKVRKISFRELSEESNRIASGLEKFDFKTGKRALLMVPPGIEFTILTFALFKIGVLPIFIDPGLGKENLLKCVEKAQPELMVAIPKAHFSRLFYHNSFRSIRRFVTVGTRWLFWWKTLESLRNKGNLDFKPTEITPDSPAAILFTSGSTGFPKGVVYTHKMFNLQAHALQTIYDFQAGEIDLPTFPLFALFSTVLGMTCVIPDMDPKSPAKITPDNILDPANEYCISNTFGSPALWETVSRYCIKNQKILPAFKRILMAGAPISGVLLERLYKITHSQTKIFTPYGSTEALPVTSIESMEVREETWGKTQRGEGVCVGSPVPGMVVKIIKITDEPIEQWDSKLERSHGKIGEITVKGPWVTREYFKNEAATNLAKIKDGEGFWHRMGDVGYIDEKGRLWFCGRKSQRVITKNRTLFTIPCEAIFNCHQDVRRSALVGLGFKGKQTPVIIIESEQGKHPENEEDRRPFANELIKLAKNSPIKQDIKRILFHPNFPVDARHNAKIFREKLTLWAEKFEC
tara:strand:+ start:2764 stop:4401 length:1638 start_codon:yes stop_codon:yes gene_type:complete